MLQQYLPFTVLKRIKFAFGWLPRTLLQQYLPFTVLKPSILRSNSVTFCLVATVLTVYGIETSDR